MKSFKRAVSLILALCVFCLPFLLTSCMFDREEPQSTTFETVSVYYGTEESSESQTQTTTSATTSATAATTKQSTTAKPTTTKPTTTKATTTKAKSTTASQRISESGKYYSKDDVALYIHTYHHLPSNFITKNEARSRGWEGGSVEPYFPGGAIGGDRYSNYEGTLPSGKQYYECDIDTLGKSSRGAKRIVYSTDGSVYYTSDHYETFTQLY